MKHPCNPMVEIVTHPSLYLIEVYEIENVSETNTVIHVKDRNKFFNELTINWDIKIPRKVIFEKYSDIKFLNLFETNDVQYIRKCIVMGYVIKNLSTGERTKVRNKEYEYFQNLRGNQYDFLYHYLTLRQSGKIREYLGSFPEKYSEMKSYRDLFHKFTENVYFYYFSVNITKTNKLSDIPYFYRKYVYNLHGLYISEKNNDAKFKVTKYYVINYVNNLHPSILIKSLNQYLDYCNSC